jgi:hypothetical protein
MIGVFGTMSSFVHRPASGVSRNANDTTKGSGALVSEKPFPKLRSYLLRHKAELAGA